MTSKLNAAALCAAAIMGAAAWGCGGSDEDKVAETVETYMTGLADGDGDQACDQLTGDAKRALVDQIATNLPEIDSISCPEVLEQLSGVLGEDEKGQMRDLEVTATVDGDTATATVEGGTSDVELTKVDGKWLISGGFEF